jgi:NhaA family Na+:H+ antiporter
MERFLHIEAASGILLLVAAALALAWANSPWREAYVHLWHVPVGVRIGGFIFERSLEWVGERSAPRSLRLDVAPGRAAEDE